MITRPAPPPALHAALRSSPRTAPPRPQRLLALLAAALPLALLGMAAPAQARIVISQVYGGGGNAGATFRNDFIEIFNNATQAVNLNGWAVQYASATGTSWAVTAIGNKTIPAGGYLLIQQAAGNGGTTDLPTPDVIGTLAMSGTAGKVALTRSVTALSGATPSGGDLADAVGYGGATSIEGTPAGATTNATAALRNLGGCTDTNNNSLDFTITAPTPRNSATAIALCSPPGPEETGTPPPPPPPPPPTLLTPIAAIQGSAATSPLLVPVPQTVLTSGVVTKINSNGFFIQDPVGDGNPATSEGLFVFTSTAPPAAAVPGNLVQVVGTVTEFSSGAGTAATPLTQLTNATVTLLGSGTAIAPTVVTLPLAAGDSLERFEGMLVQISTTMTVQQNFFQARFGQVTLGAGGRHENVTNRHRPLTAEALALDALQARGRILLDDGSALQNPNPTPYFSGGTLPRAGDTVSGLTGVLDFGLATATSSSFGLYRLHPTAAPVFVASNPRPPVPPVVGGNMRVAAMNVLNYFTTFTNGQTASGQTGQGCTLGGSTSAGNCRGASNIDEFLRQQAKIVRALAGLDADAVGLMEIQNSTVATQNLVAALNAFVGSNTWAAVPDPAFTGTDAIKLAILYKPAKLSLVGAAMSDADAINNRPTLAQTFQAANGERFSLVVNHLKSKGSCPSGSPASNPDADQGDGQGCWNATRLAQAERLKSWVGTVQTAGGTTDTLLVGDMNSYGQEDPIFALTSASWVDQLLRFSPFAYTYIFDGVSGRLDHALASSTLSPKVTFAKAWQINADEQVAHDFNLEFKAPAVTCGGLCPADPYDGSTPFRSSDHDPALVGLNIYKTINGTAGADTLPGTAGDDILTGGPGADRQTGGAGADLFVFASVLDGGDTITDFTSGQDKIVVRDILRSLGRSALVNPIASGHITCNTGRGISAIVGIDSDGSAGPQPSRVLVLLQGQTCAAVMSLQNFMY